MKNYILSTFLLVIAAAFAVAQKITPYQVVSSGITGATTVCPTYQGQYTNYPYTYYTAGGCGHDSFTDTDTWEIDGGGIIVTGTNAVGQDWVTVYWINSPSTNATSTGAVKDNCSNTLNVKLLQIAQPVLSPTTETLCGNGSVTLKAQVSSSTNITGYYWNIAGAGFDKTGTQNTTTPSITLNYSNWGNPTSYSPTVAVGSVNSNCPKDPLETPVSPLVGQTILGNYFPPIPRSAWTQFSSGTPSAAPTMTGSSSFYNNCDGSPNSFTYSISNLPQGTTGVTWSILNGTGLTLTYTYTGSLKTGITLSGGGSSGTTFTISCYCTVGTCNSLVTNYVVTFVNKYCLPPCVGPSPPCPPVQAASTTFSAYPNPTQNKTFSLGVDVETAGAYSMSIVDNTGNPVLTKDFGYLEIGNYIESISLQQTGIFTIKIIGGGTTQYQKLVVQ